MSDEKNKDEQSSGNNLNDEQPMAVLNMHKTLLEALRHREQEILRYIAILAPALGGFIWLLNKVNLESENGAFIFTVGTLGVLFLLFVGAMYSLALGYNYRYVTLQLAKMESDSCLNIKEFILESWLKTAKEWKKEYGKSWMPYCAPPEIIKVFWLSFIIAKIFVFLTATLFLCTKCEDMTAQIHLVIIGGLLCIVIAALIAPMFYGWKLCKTCEKEPDEWRKAQD